MAGKKTKMKRKSNGKAASSRTTSTTAKKMPSIKDPMTKGGMIKTIADVTGVSKKDVSTVFECLPQLIERHVKSGGPGKFVLPGMMKIVVVKKPARAARKGINPFTGEEITIKAKPASKGVRIRPLKKLKEMVA